MGDTNGVNYQTTSYDGFNSTFTNDSISEFNGYSGLGRKMSNGNTYQTLSYVLLKYVSPAICIFGILGNVLTLLILTRRTLQKSMQSMERSSNYGLAALSVSDILFCITVLPKAFIHTTKIHSSINFSLVYTVYGAAVVNIFITSSTLLTVATAMQRYLAICYPIKARMVIDFKRIKITILCVFIVSILLNLPRFWKDKITEVPCTATYFRGLCSQDNDNNNYLYIRRNSYLKLKTNAQAKNAYMIVHFILSVAIPLILLTFCNTNLIRALRNSSNLRRHHSNRKREPKCMESTHRITLTFVVIIILFFILVTPAEITNFVREFKHTVRSHNLYLYKFIIDLVNTLQKVNFAFNFVLYCVINVHFRKTMWNILNCRLSDDNAGQSEVLSRRSTMRTTLKFSGIDLQVMPNLNSDMAPTIPEKQLLVHATPQHRS